MDEAAFLGHQKRSWRCRKSATTDATALRPVGVDGVGDVIDHHLMAVGGQLAVGRRDVRPILYGRRQCPLWVKSRHFATTLRMSAFGGKADIIQGVAECPLIAISGPSDERCGGRSNRLPG